MGAGSRIINHNSSDYATLIWTNKLYSYYFARVIDFVDSGLGVPSCMPSTHYCAISIWAILPELQMPMQNWQSWITQIRVNKI